jgi:hypothetical protein
MKTPAALLLFAACVFTAYPEDAFIVPQDILRLTIAPSYNFADRAWGGDWKPGNQPRYFNVGLALEYGLSGWISAFADWTPGVNLWSSIKPLTTGGGKMGYFADAFLGIKLGILGSEAPLKTEKMRFSAALGVHEAFPSRKNSIYEIDTHLWGLGLRLYYDYIVNPHFFINVYTEFLYNPEQKSDSVNFGKVRVDHPVDMTFEIEPQGSYPLGQTGAVIIKGGLPFTYAASPRSKLKGIGSVDDEKHNFTIGFAVSLRFTDFQFPFEIKLQHRLPVAGKNDFATDSVILSGKVDFKL